MKIDDNITNYISKLNNEAVKPAVKKVDGTGAQSIANDAPIAVDLSTTAVRLSEDEARRDRLNIIRQQLAEGSYNISGKDVADKMLKVLKG